MYFGSHIYFPLKTPLLVARKTLLEQDLSSDDKFITRLASSFIFD